MSERLESIKEIEDRFRHADVAQYSFLCDHYAADERKGVKNTVLRYHKKYQAYLLENKRIENLKRKELELIDQGYSLIAGIDEVGRGPLCGPVVSAAVILPRESAIPFINDSKQLTEKMREELYGIIMKEAVSVGIGIVDNVAIDRINILNATKQSMMQAVNQLQVKPDLLILDAVTLDISIPQKSFIKGDENFYSIAAASIVAKVTRDRMMYEYASQYPAYGFDSNKGYGSQQYVDAIREYGPTPIHRKSFLTNIVQKQTAHKIGLSFEKIAVEYLKKKGCQIVTTNFRRSGGEIDIVCKDGADYVFCEVKARKDTDSNDPKEYVDRNKQEKLIRTAEQYMAEKAIFDTGRFDVIAITYRTDQDYQITHHQNAF